MFLPSRSVAFVLMIACAYTLPASAQSPDSDDPYALIHHDVSFEKEVKPILRKKCMACHACYDAPAQLNFTNAFGVERGAAKIDPYVARMERAPFFKLQQTDKSIDDFRRLGFFSVTEGGKDSIMAKMIDLAYDENHRWKPNEAIPTHIQIDSITHLTQAPNKTEIAGYAMSKPRQGMPFAAAGLDAKEYTTLMTWLEQGAKYDTTAPQPTAVEKKLVNQWESFLNQDGLKNRLIGRYVFEHMYAYHCYFDNNSPHFFALVRSSTPPGQPVKPISTRYANSEIKGAFWYRFMVVDLEIHLKRHVPVDCTGDTLQKYCKDLLFAIPFEVDKLPGYTEAERINPLTTFAAIPAKSRYHYVLHNAFNIHRCVITGPSCRGSLNVSTTPEHIWFIYEDPKTSLLCNDQEYYDAVAPLIDRKRELTGVFSTIKQLQAYIDASEKVKALAISRLREDPRSSIDDIWKGDNPGDITAITSVRHDDNAMLVAGLNGPFPANLHLGNLGTIERRYYLSDVNFDVFSPVGELLATRENYADNRLDGELNYIRFFPPKERNKELMTMFKNGVNDPIVRKKLPADLNLPSEFHFKTDDHRKEFMLAVMEHLKGTVPIHDTIFRLEDGSQPDNVAKAFLLIKDKADELYGNKKTSFRQYLGESTVVRIDSPNKDPRMYTMAVRWGIEQLDSVGKIFLRPPMEFDRVDVYDTAMTAYPNFMFHIKDSEAMEFATALTEANSDEKFLAVVERWGVRRTSPNFWETFHSIEDYMRRKDPRYAGILDANRYIDYSPGNMVKHRLVDPRLIPGESGLAN